MLDVLPPPPPFLQLEAFVEFQQEGKEKGRKCYQIDRKLILTWFSFVQKQKLKNSVYQQKDPFLPKSSSS